MVSSTSRRVSIRDVASLAGVSVGTVSNVLNRPALVAEDTRHRVETAIQEIGFIRHGPARQLRAGTSSAVGAVVLDLANPFFTEVARGVEDRLAEEDCVLILGSSDEDPGKQQRHLRLLEEQGVRGLIVSPADDDREAFLDTAARGTPVVLLDRRLVGSHFCSVAVDDVLGGELVADHLLQRGHVRLGFVNGPTTIGHCADQRLGVRRAVQRAGADPGLVVEVTVGALNAGGGEAALDELLTRDASCTAILCANDLVALGVLRGLRHRGIRVPEDIAVVGYDDVEFAVMLTPSLTSVKQPTYRLGHAAADLLLQERTEGHRHRQVLFQPELVVRDSSGVAHQG